MVEWDHTRLAEHMGGAFTFVGNLPEWNVVAVALEGTCRESEETSVGVVWDCFPDALDDVVLVGSDDEGEACDVDVASVCQQLAVPWTVAGA